mgnify:CR=1 FL=1
MPAATLPLAGTELVPVVQAGANKETPASSFIAALTAKAGEPAEAATVSETTSAVFLTASITVLDSTNNSIHHKTKDTLLFPFLRSERRV